MDGAACGDSSNWRHHHAVSGDRTPVLNKQSIKQAADLHGTVRVLGLQLRDQPAPVTGVQAQREGLRQARVSESRRQGTVRSSGPPVLPRKPITSVDSTATSDPTQPHTALVRRGWVAVTGATLLHVRHAVEEGVVQQQLKHAASSTGSEAREGVRHDRASSTGHVVGDGQHVAWPHTTTLAPRTVGACRRSTRTERQVVRACGDVHNANIDVYSALAATQRVRQLDPGQGLVEAGKGGSSVSAPP